MSPSTKSKRFLLGQLPFLLLGLALLYLALGGQDFGDLSEALAQVDYRWALAVLAITFLNHASRAHRWYLLLRPLGRTSPVKAFHAMLFGYLVNYAVPRLGEVSRCAALYKTDRLPIAKTLGTVVTERAIDVACLFLVLLLALWLQYERMAAFFHDNMFAPILSNLGDRAYAGAWIGLLAAAFLLVMGIGVLIFRHRIKSVALFQKGAALAQDLWLGIGSVAKVRPVWLFLAHTVFIWIGYFLMTWLWFFSLPATTHLSVGAGLTLMVVGSLGRTVPIQGGGMGAYHYLFAQAALLYGVSLAYGGALAIVIHGFQTVFHLSAGGISAIWLGWKQKKADQGGASKNESVLSEQM